MATTSFTDGETIIVASWLNEVDALVHDIFNGLSTTTKGDVLASNGTNIIPLAVGSNNQVLTADSSEATGVKWGGIEVSSDTTPQLGGFLDPNDNFIGMQKGGDIGSASPTVVDTDGDYFIVTGTTNFSALTVAADRHFFLEFAGVLTITHGSGTIDLPGGANITTAAGDVAEFVSTAANVVTCVNYTKVNGEAVVGGAGGLKDDGGNVVGVENAVTTAGDFEVTNGFNLVTGGPFTIASGHTVTVNADETWTVV